MPDYTAQFVRGFGAKRTAGIAENPLFRPARMIPKSVKRFSDKIMRQRSK